MMTQLPPSTSKPITRPVQQSRLTVVETVHHQPAKGQAISCESRYSRQLKDGDETPFIRTQTVDDTWKKVETGWIKDCGMLVLSNEEGKDRQTYPSEDEKRDQAEKVIEVAVVNTVEGFLNVYPFGLILPGESLRVHPANIELVYVRLRAAGQKVKCVVSAFPG
jgi:hypothetical protein